MIVTLNPCSPKYKECLLKKGGMGVALGSKGVSRPGASEASDTRARDLCCIFATPLYVVASDIPYVALLYYYNTTYARATYPQDINN